MRSVRFRAAELRSARPAQRQLKAAADFLPRAGDAGQHRDGARRHAAAFRALHAVVQPDHRRARGGVFARQLANVIGRNAGPLRHALRRIFLHLFAQLLEAQRVLRDVVGVVQSFSPMITCIMPRASAASVPGLMGRYQSAHFGGARAVGIDHYQLRAVAPRFHDERPQVHVVAVDIRAPGDDVA